MAVASPPPSAGRSHPTYKEMVVQALTELQESGGSSRDAISRYIADHFSGLPARHDDLLSVHLRRLRSQGLLLMSGYSYLLPSAAPGNPPRRGRGRPRKTPSDQKRGPGRPRKIADLSTSAPLLYLDPRPATPVAAAAGVKRGPGRPRKNTTPVSASGVKRGRGRPPKNSRILTAAPESVALAAIATAPVVNIVKRGRGRPPKVLLPAYSSIPSLLVAGMRKRGRPPKDKRPESVPSVALATRGPARPRKERSLGGGHLRAGVEARLQTADQAADVRNGCEVSHLPSSGTSSTEKRGRGRPRKRPLETERTETALVEKRGPGRPKKNSSAPLSVETEGVAMSGYKRGRGRPRKRPLETQTPETALVEKRGPGRPRKKNPSAPLSRETEGVAISGYKRGRGRPRKGNPSPGTYAKTGIIASMGNKRGRGRPRKDVSFGTESLEAAVVVSRDLAESKPEKADTLVSGNKTETESLLSRAGIEVSPTNAEGALVSGEKASTGHVDAKGATLRVDPVISNLDMDHRSL